MKLITHNMLTSRCLRGVVTGYPLAIEAREVKQLQVDYNPEFVQRILPKVTWDVLQKAAQNFGVELPTESPLPADPKNEQIPDDVCKQIHHALFEIEVIDGELICPETGRKFPIRKGIPNMLCNEDEV